MLPLGRCRMIGSPSAGPLNKLLVELFAHKPSRERVDFRIQKHFFGVTHWVFGLCCVPSRATGVPVAKLRYQFNPTCLLHCHATRNYAPTLQWFAENRGFWRMPVIYLCSSTSCLPFLWMCANVWVRQEKQLFIARYSAVLILVPISAPL